MAGSIAQGKGPDGKQRSFRVDGDGTLEVSADELLPVMVAMLRELRGIRRGIELLCEEPLVEEEDET